MEGQIMAFIILSTTIVLLFIVGSIIFIIKYQRALKEKIETQKQTMEYIGREIHDSISQHLALASIYSTILESENQNKKISDKVLAIRDIITESLFKLRQLSTTLSDASLNIKSLTDLIKSECDLVNATGKYNASVEGGCMKEISLVVKTSLLRVVQEFIQNSIKHSQCKTIKIRLKEHLDGLSIIADDDGKGFNLYSTQRKGTGINNMKLRISKLNGRIFFNSSAGKGTSISVFIPGNSLCQH